MSRPQAPTSPVPNAYDANVAYELKTPTASARQEAIMKNSALMKQWA